MEIPLRRIRDDPVLPERRLSPARESRLVAALDTRVPTCPEFANGLDLRAAQTLTLIYALALQNTRIETAATRVFEHSVLDAVECIAGCIDGIADELRISLGDSAFGTRKQC